MHDIPLRPRTPTEIVDASFQLYRRNIAPILLMSAVAYAPAVVLSLLIVATTTTVPGEANPVLIAVLAVARFLISWLGYALMSGAVNRLTSDVYLGRDADVGGSVRATLPRVPALMGATLLKTLAMFAPGFGVGIALAIAVPLLAKGGGTAGAVAVLVAIPLGGAAIVAGLYLFASYFAVAPLVVLENEGAARSLARSARLANGRRMPILGALTLVLLIYGIMLMVAFFASAMIFGFNPGQTVGDVLVMNAFVIVAYPLYAITEMLLYYDARIRNEGYDVEVMAAALGPAATPAAAPAPAPEATTR